MDRMSSFPNQDFEGLVSEIWLAYVTVYADTIAMQLAGSRRHRAVMETKRVTGELLFLQPEGM